jgi:hypothetical protein
MSQKEEPASHISPTEEHFEDVEKLGGTYIAIQTDTYAIDERALGINLPKHYYLSPGFIGTVVVCCPVPFLLTMSVLISSYRRYVLGISAIILAGSCPQTLFC